MSLIKHFADGPDSWFLMKEIAHAKIVCKQALKDVEEGKAKEVTEALRTLSQRLEKAF